MLDLVSIRERAASRDTSASAPARQPEKAAAISAPSLIVGPLTAAARRLPKDAREVLDFVLWIYPDTGAVNVRSLGDASRLPLGLIWGSLDQLQAAGLVSRTSGAWFPSAALRRELAGLDRTADDAPMAPSTAIGLRFDSSPHDVHRTQPTRQPQDIWDAERQA